ncbi:MULTISPECIES: hypothetical protein [unclassified Pseudomonas]|uniref:Uncharacterized protein n=1 Tax=Pseudomonas sp. MYb327 TaxID=2745230 RepID=A0AAU8DWL8_9PSED
MKHRIMRVKKGEDFPVYEGDISIALAKLTVIMGWIEDEVCLHDYRLTESQIVDIEKASSLDLPRNLDLYLTSQI